MFRITMALSVSQLIVCLQFPIFLKMVGSLDLDLNYLSGEVISIHFFDA